MRKLVVIFASLLISATSASAYTIDGDSSDWGVTAFTDWVPDSATAFYTVEDDIFYPEPTEERWDREAIYFDSDADNLYFMIFSSASATYGLDTDLAIDVNDDGTYDFAVDFQGLPQRPVLSDRDVIAVTDWETRHGQEWNLPLYVNEGTTVGQAQVFQRNLGSIEDDPYGTTWIVEGMIDIDLLGLSSLCDVDLELLITRVSCLKDVISVSGKCTTGCEVPEPGSLLLLGAGLLGAGRIRRRRA